MKKPANNKGVTIAEILCFADTFEQGGGAILRMKFSATAPPSQTRKPWVQLKTSVKQ